MRSKEEIILDHKTAEDSILILEALVDIRNELSALKQALSRVIYYGDQGRWGVYVHTTSPSNKLSEGPGHDSDR